MSSSPAVTYTRMSMLQLRQGAEGHAKELLREHYAELRAHSEVFALAPDWDAYEQLDAAGCLHAVVAAVDGTWVGYVISCRANHLDDRTTCVAENLVIYVDPLWRTAGIGRELVAQFEGHARDEWECAQVLWAAAAGSRLERMLGRPGSDYVHHATVYRKKL